MSFISKLLGVAVTAGATVAAMKVADKYKKNNPEGVQPAEGQEKAGVNEMLDEVGKAATEVYNDAAAAVKQTAEKAKEMAPDVIDKVRQTAKNAVESITGKDSVTVEQQEEEQAPEQPEEPAQDTEKTE